jgi:hypothetical protein
MKKYLPLLFAVMLIAWTAYAQDAAGQVINAPEIAGLLTAVAMVSPAFGYLLVKRRK